MVTKIRDIIEYYAGHEVSDDIKEKVLEIISCSKEEDDLNDAFRDLWDKADTAYMDEEEISSAYARLEGMGNDNKEKAKTLRIFTWAKVAAVVVPLVMLVVFAKLYMQMSDKQQASQTVAMLQEHTINKEYKIITLEDGTKVSLKQSSVLIYPSSFQGSERKVFLTGEAFFDVKHNDKMRFHVSTPYFEITDLGTSFTVSSYTTDEEVSTTLKTGKVDVRLIGEDRSFVLNPNDQLVYNVRTKSVNIHQVTKDEDGVSWRNKSIDLNDVTLAKAADILGKTYGMKFTFLSQRYQDTKITVHFNRGETLVGAMSIVKDLIPGLQYEIKNNEVIVK